jgi:phospholipase C
VKDFARSFPESTTAARQYIMGYYPLGFLPSLHALARDFIICDHWFSSLPGPTWPNRFFALTGTSNGRVNMPGDGEHTVDLAGWFEQDQETLFDRLTERGINWKIYFHDIPPSCVLTHQRMPHNAARYFYIDELFDDARGAEADFPQFCLIEPDYMGAEQNDDHPPHDVMRAEKLIADVYNSIRANESLWQTTLLVIFYDEHGGFYDHVEPPPIMPPDQHLEEYTFNRLGVRVPALLVSPWVDRRPESTQFDHTSLLKYVIDKWQLGPLGNRAVNATSIRVALTRTMLRNDNDMIRRIELTQGQLNPPDPEIEEQAWRIVSAHHRALQAFENYLKIEAVENLGKMYTVCARVIETIKTWCKGLLDHVYNEPPNISVSITELDKLARETIPLRENFARFLAHQKRKAIPEIAKRIRDTHLSLQAREHAVHTLALISHRRFHQEPDRIRRADVWLQRKGH